MFSRTIALLSGLLLLAGCNKPDDVMEMPLQPQGYQELLSAYESGYTYLRTEVDKSSGTTTVVFQEKSLPLGKGSIAIHDHRTSSLPPIGFSKENRMWTMNGQITGIQDHTGMSDEKAYPVYAWYDKSTLHILVSNHNQLDFKFIPKEPLPGARKFRIPSVRIYTDNGSPIESKDEYIGGRITVSDPDGTYSQDMSLTLDGKFKGRGNSTWGMPKKPYRIKLDQKASLLGMPKSRNWALLANYSDKSLLRNRTAMLISTMAGMSWTPSIVPVEVYLNDSYIGLYDLCEHKETGPDKVNINVVAKDADSGEDLEGDYYLEIDENMDEPVCFYTRRKRVPVMFSDPETPNQAQQEYIRNYLDAFETALFGSDFKDREKGYAAYIDIDSFIGNYIIQELSKNIDGNLRRSTFLTKQKGQKLKMYHVWDFDLAFGNADYFPNGIGNGPEGMWVRDYGPYGKNSGWYYRLFQDDAFKERLAQRWKELYPQLERIPEYIDIMVEELQGAQNRNFTRWPILREHIWPNVKVPGSYAGEVDYLKEFYSQRLELLNNRIESLY